MPDATCEVPIMLSVQNLEYEDIAKLNPFYEEYRAFWNLSPEATNTSLSSSVSSRSSSLQSIQSDMDIIIPPLSYSVSPPMRHIKPSAQIPVSQNHHVAFHDGNECKLSYGAYDELIPGQMAVFDYDSHDQQPLLSKESVQDCASDVFDLDLVDNPLRRNAISHKKLFGEKGWLGGTDDLNELSGDKPKPTVFKGLKKKIKQHVGEIVEIAEDVAKAYPIPFSYGPRRLKIVPKSTIPISLDPPTQAKLYSELEVMICVSANSFLVQQYEKGRISGESIKKVTSYWGSKNRPQVVEFQFDQATQRRLVLSNIRTLQFNGETSTNPILLHSNLHNWKAIVKEMSVRTFCAPDSVIRKHMHDIHKLLDMLGAPVATFLAFQKLQMRTLSLMQQRLERQYYGKTRAHSVRV